MTKSPLKAYGKTTWNFYKVNESYNKHYCHKLVRCSHVTLIRGIYILGVILMIASCQSAQPKLHPKLLPQGYEQPLADSNKPAFVVVNRDEQNISSTIHAVMQVNLQKHLSNLHPINGGLTSREFKINRHAVYNLLQIFYLWKPLPKDIISATKTLGCKPLSNLELQFLLHLYSSLPFREKTSNLLFLTAEELMLQQGYKPSYYPITSPYLAAKFQRKMPIPLNRRNLFATGRRIAKDQKNGFIYCRKIIK